MSEIDFEYTSKAILVSFLLLIIGQTPIIKPLKSIYYEIANPLQIGFYTLGRNIQDEWRFILNLRRLKGQNYEYEKEIQRLTSELSKLKEVEAENKILKEQLNLKLEAKPASTFAQVLGRDSVQGRAVILINKGTEGGLQVGQVVVLGNNLLGHVEEVSNKRSKVRLITDSQNSVAVLDQDSRDRARGLLKGQYATTLIMEKIYQDEEISVGDTIITSGEDEKYPKGLIVGKIKRVYEGEDRVLKSAEVEPLVDLSKLEKVFIIF